ncbi:MAG: MBOAT family protein [Candidatus Sericytochromatia bacterium]|nr:MBOAT family protein [Candidatus Sericytochromatia bacterium]
MLFNSQPFLFLFLPAVWLGYFWLAPRHALAGPVWLCLASLAFYAGWSPWYVALLVGSIAFNHGAGRLIARWREGPRGGWVLAGAIVADLVLLGYYKYAGFFAASLAGLTGLPLAVGQVVLPLGISFFTFTQIAWLVDVRRGLATDLSAWRYALFVTYFPHLVAGPILHHAEVMPQFADPANRRVRPDLVALGLAVFTVGLAKKVLLADPLGRLADPVFLVADAGTVPTALEAWLGALGYTLQLYFDFSGYSDMAIGLSLLFGIRLPLNFDSPYRATSIIDFWRRWHMTLSRFLRDYLYVSLGGNRRGPARRWLNVWVTMLLGGLWHGASWTFVAWGALHGAYLVVNHAWRGWLGDRLPTQGWAGRAYALGAGGLTFLAVVVAWLPFRAPTFEAAGRVAAGLLAWPALPAGGPFPHLVGDFAPSPGPALAYLVAGLGLVWLAPNTATTFGLREGEAAGEGRWRPSLAAAVALAALCCASLAHLHRESPFLYYQF